MPAARLAALPPATLRARPRPSCRAPHQSARPAAACRAVQTTVGAQLTFHTYTILESLTVKALELGATVTGGSFTTPQDWRRAAYVAAALGVGLFGYRSYTSMAGECAGAAGWGCGWGCGACAVRGGVLAAALGGMARGRKGRRAAQSAAAPQRSAAATHPSP